jgi:separase
MDHKNPAISLIVSHQTYTLRMIARVRRPRLVEETWGCLKLSNPSSPANLLWLIAKSSNGDPKTIRQLESLAQAVLALCPSISRSEDPSGDQNQLQPPPDVVLSLQHLAFKIRQRWWALADHQGNKEKELIEPFSKCMAAFARRSQLSAVKKYRVAELLFTDLMGSSNDLANILQGESSGSVTLAIKTLVSLAESADLPEEALRWLGTQGSPSDSIKSAAGAATQVIQEATLFLDAFLKDPEKSSPDVSITRTLEILRGDLGGSSSELDSLFLQVNRLRRSAAKALSMGAQSASAIPALRYQAVRVISSSVHLTARYLGSSGTADMDSQTQARHAQRVLLVTPYVKSIIDSACLCSKIPIEHEPEEHWTNMETLLHDCRSILRHYGEDSGSGQPLPPELQQSFVKLSNAYWAVHLQLKAINASSKSVTRAMRRSVELIQTRPRAEQQSGLLVMKLERLAEALETEGRIQSSQDALEQCVQALISIGTLQDAVELAKTRPLQQVWESTDVIITLGRVLKAYHRSFLKASVNSAPELAFYDSEELSVAGRGLLLEWQLALYLKVLSKNRAWDSNLNQSLRTMSDRLQVLYSMDQFPIRRRRVQILLLQLSQNHPDILPHSMRQVDADIAPSSSIGGTEDQGLQKYESHLKALWKLKSCMQDSTLDAGVVQECCSVWQPMLDSASSWKELSGHVDDIELWLAELKTTSDYLAATGEEYTCVILLHQLAKALELDDNTDPSRVIGTMCALGLLLLRLGYSGKAGLALAKADPLVSNQNVSTDAKLQWHLSYAEYLVHIGNTSKW